MFEELRAAGMTEWLGRVFQFGELASAGRPSRACRRTVASSARSPPTRPGGFSDAHVERDCGRCCRCSRLAAKATTMRTVYAGAAVGLSRPGPGGRVLAGTVQRGEVQGVEAVLFFTDLRGFTALADTLPGRDLIMLLDDCFDCMVRPVTARGGEVLKFLGDGLFGHLPDRGQAARRDLCDGARSGQGGAGADGEPGRDAPRPVAADARARHRACTSAT